MYIYMYTYIYTYIYICPVHVPGHGLSEKVKNLMKNSLPALPLSFPPALPSVPSLSPPCPTNSERRRYHVFATAGTLSEKSVT